MLSDGGLAIKPEHTFLKLLTCVAHPLRDASYELSIQSCVLVGTCRYVYALIIDIYACIAW